MDSLDKYHKFIDKVGEEKRHDFRLAFIAILSICNDFPDEEHDWDYALNEAYKQSR